MVDGARERREAIRQLADLRRRLAAAEEALAGAHAASKHAEEALDAASDRFDDAGRAFDAAREDRAQARRERYAARQAYERAAAADRLQRRVTELSDRLGRMAELTSTAPRRGGRWPAGRGSRLPRAGRHIRAKTKLSPRTRRRRCCDWTSVLIV